jgi:hypothetical protein
MAVVLSAPTLVGDRVGDGRRVEDVGGHYLDEIGEVSGESGSRPDDRRDLVAAVERLVDEQRAGATGRSEDGQVHLVPLEWVSIH